MLRAGRTTLPYCMSWGTIERTMSMGMANPTPAEVPVFVKMAVLTPITRPCRASHSLSVWNTPHQQLNLHCLTGSVKEQAQYSTQGQKRDSCPAHHWHAEDTRCADNAEHGVCVDCAEETISSKFSIVHNVSNIGIITRILLNCNGARKEVDPPESLVRAHRYCQD